MRKNSKILLIFNALNHRINHHIPPLILVLLLPIFLPQMLPPPHILIPIHMVSLNLFHNHSLRPKEMHFRTPNPDYTHHYQYKLSDYNPTK